MKKFIEKLIGRLEGRKEKVLPKENYMFGNIGLANVEGFNRGIKTAISIVNQHAEEYKGGWIPCDKELPTTEGTYWATLHDVQSGYEYVRRVHWNSFFKRWLWDNGKPLSNLIEVVAWQNINRPEPYTEGVRK